MLRNNITAALALLVLASQPVRAAELGTRTSGPAPIRTRWIIHPSEGLDAIAFLGALSGDELQQRFYAADVQRYRARMNDEERAAFDHLGEVGRRMKILVGPTLMGIFSAGPTDTLEDALQSAEQPEGRLRAGMERRPDWNAQTWSMARQIITDFAAPALRALKRLGFDEEWRTRLRPLIDADAGRYRQALAPYDVIAQDERLLGHPLDPELELVLLHYNNPYGARITGQRFVSHHERKPADQLLIAAHEIFHPPYGLTTAALKTLLAPLIADPWMVSIVRDHDQAFGYNNFASVFEEASAQALDQIVSERLGVGGELRTPAKRWREADGGMHMVAAALYRAMKDDGFDRSGGSFEAWLKNAVDRGVLTPENVKRLAAEVVGQDAVDAWGPHRAATRTDGTGR